MLRFFAVFIPLFAPSLAQGCQVDLARLPTTPPSATLSLQAPREFVGGSYRLQVSLSAIGEVRLVEHTARLRRANHTYNSQGLVCTAGSLATVPLGVADNGQHRLVLEAYVYLTNSSAQAPAFRYGVSGWPVRAGIR